MHPSDPSQPPVAPGALWDVEAPVAAAPSRVRAGARASVAGLVAIVAGAGSLGATLLPVTVWGDDSQEPFTILPITTGFDNLDEFSWFALEPIGVGLAAIELGIILLIARRPMTGGGGALLAFGFTTLLAFSAYALSTILTESYGESYGPGMGPGTFLGLTSALLLFVAGALALSARPRGR